MNFTAYVHKPVFVKATDVITDYLDLVPALDELGLPARLVDGAAADAPHVEVFDSEKRQWVPVPLQARVIEASDGRVLPILELSFQANFIPQQTAEAPSAA